MEGCLLAHHCHSPRRRGIQYAAAHRFNHCCHGVLDRPPARAMTAVVVAETLISPPNPAISRA
ncbi:hypothetical protein C7U92_11045 [Bradyrhizobium sp. WBOS7]|uniref:Uncharacterized protein n=1 Tax=Bradyrhizobium betae TaxID=244734 RepID=A0AAE9N4L0_9BRAD|nr:hypothetical protein [Bradyrhizobium sp. WBOS2]MDD1572545.1 hypothetical protein [Bradyrhizobium sp. WBOS1]MDD1577266.1 hypothetical protein [Bradyrhizobium sp. WBOS7]MDD1600313.1 hypothetical protein [Bradyrhizobium sp. WBOS16]UUO34071.1 hypothetical protein DCK84_05425 [Bradyrhizobium sp. WBOS01]UUO40395.1 hypothetical protein DCM75_06280 [Bradyrhizobium sp. WBOS02]UUO52561.1 hypothetical protein DCM79_05920 [Bradyrhizobium sp. WBOS07]UUO64687.1 hypothetical protein DCM83_05295 [Bradyrh